MPDTTNDIDALLEYLNTGRTPNWYESSTRWHAALAALVAERDALKAKVATMHNAMHDMARRQVEREEHEDERQSIDLRERLVCAALTGLCAKGMHSTHTSEVLSATAVVVADATLAAMRKGESDGK